MRKFFLMPSDLEQRAQAVAAAIPTRYTCANGRLSAPQSIVGRKIASALVGFLWKGNGILEIVGHLPPGKRLREPAVEPMSVTGLSDNPKLPGFLDFECVRRTGGENLGQIKPFIVEAALMGYKGTFECSLADGGAGSGTGTALHFEPWHCPEIEMAADQPACIITTDLSVEGALLDLKLKKHDPRKRLAA